MERLSQIQYLKLAEVDSLSLKDVGLLNIDNIDLVFPQVEILDLGNNRIFAIEAVEILHKLPSLAEVSFKDNPICVHKHLN
mmetsp:Transcript_5135/g.7875  ORF Transcript_5135/g.7875 Transcript_5135/m.7875 type:complete len:81 (+) Transcript_5135:201-443(+)